jgi:hypothetical protein
MNQHFASLVLGLAQQAEGALSGKLPPEGLGGVGAREVGQALIDTLGMLQEKTAGQLEADEQKLIDEVLTALRFRFVQGAPKP